MTNDKWNEMAEEFLGEMRSTLVQKARDYNDDQLDRLDNFKAIAAITGLSPSMVGFVLAAKHITAIARHCRGNKCVTEDVRKRLIDLGNYCILIAGLDEDEKSNGNREEVPGASLGQNGG